MCRVGDACELESASLTHDGDDANSNFKNYVGEHTIEIDGEPFVCFFGRNGAGKSCVVDAIAFCLGATPQQLRVKRFTKLVNDIVAARDPSATASVALCFQADGQNPIWIRRAVDGASSQSKYQFSDTSTLLWKSGSKTTVEAALRCYGVDMELQDRFIIRQTNASALAQMSSVQLLHFCERIIGTSNIKDQLSELSKKWDELSSKNEILLDEISALDKEAEDCQPMVTKYQDWIEKTDKVTVEKSDLKKALAITNHGLVRHYHHDLDGLKKERVDKQDEVARLQSATETKTAECSKQSQLIDTHKIHSSKATQDLRQLTKTKAGITNQLETLLSERNAVQIRAAHFDREKEELERAVAGMDEESRADVASSADLQERYNEATKAFAALSNSGVCDDENEITTQQLVNDIGDLEAKLRKVKIVQTNQEKAKTGALKSLERIQGEITQHTSSQADMQLAMTRLEKSISQDIKDLAERQSAEEQLETMMAKVEADQILHIQRTAESSSRSQGDAIIQRLRKSLGEKVVRGRFWELAVTESRFSDAVNSALQPQLSHVVVADRPSAIHISRSFAHEAAGRVSCCILDEFDTSLECSRTSCGSRSRKQNTDGLVPLCQALQCSDIAVRRVFHKYAHNWVIGRDAEEATTVVTHGKLNCVTLQGDIFYADGSIRAFRRARGHEGTHTMRIRAVGACEGARSDEGLDPLDSNPSLLFAEKQLELRNLKTTIDALKERIESNTRKMLRMSTQADQVTSALKVLSTKQEIAQRELEIAQSESNNEVKAQIVAYSERLATLKRSKSKIVKSSGSKRRASVLSTKARCERELAAIKSRIETRKASLTKLRLKEQTTTLQQATLREKFEQLTKEVQVLETQSNEIDLDLQVADQKAKDQAAALSDARVKLQVLTSEQRDLEETLRKKRSDVKRLLVEESRGREQISALEVELAQICNACGVLDDPMDGASAQDLLDDRLKHRTALDTIEEDEQVLDSIQSTISVEVIERAIKCENELTKVRDQLQQNKTHLAALSAEQLKLMMDRHKRLVESLSIVNANFSRIYRLMNEDGDCYLGYSMERSTLFAEGVTLNCKPDESHWQSFLGLSGGQQVVCAVSLMLALQASFPKPFYVCDEIDAALDTLNVKKLAELLRDQSSQTSTQFLVVSHRPEMWEVGNFLVGVYECEKSARTISCRFE